jgi:hypothetical protein
VKANRSATFEVTAEDELGFATSAKAMPVIGVWNATEALGSLPGVAGAGEAFNGEANGMTTLTTTFTQPNQLRIGIADQRGDGRPDFNYQARVLYADSLSPATVSAAGGTITISGMGFRTGNAVTRQRCCRHGFQLDRKHDCRYGAFDSSTRLEHGAGCRCRSYGFVYRWDNCDDAVAELYCAGACA